MRVVCDNCGAVYKIADSKLSKEVNRATCKRCGHKIIIYKPGSAAAQHAHGHGSAVPGGGEDDERTVIKSVPELDRVAHSQAVPTIGSLTAELRAISIPGMPDHQAPAAPQVLGPTGGASSPAPLPALSSPALPSLGGAQQRGGYQQQTPVRPPAGIPPSSSPKTQVYNGPAPLGGQVPGGAPTPPPGRMPGSDDMTRPMPFPGANGAAQGHPQARLPTGAPPHPGQAPPPPIPSQGPPPPQTTRPATSPPPPGGVQTASRKKVAASGSAAGAGRVLGTVMLLGLVGLLGLIALPFVPHPGSAIAMAVAGWGLGAAFLLPLLTGNGKNPERAVIGIALALLIGVGLGGLQFVRANAASGTTDDFRPVPSDPVLDTAPSDEPDTTEPPGDGSADGSAEGTLGDDELAEVRRFSEDDVAGLGAGEDEPATPEVREPAPREPVRQTPPPREVAKAKVAPPKEEPTPKPRSQEPRAQIDTSAGKDAPAATASGPSPFVIDTIIRNNAAIKRCLRVEMARGQQDVKGKIFLRFSIAPDGSVSNGRVTTSRFAGTSLDTCISKELNQLTFPPFDGNPKKISYPLIVQ